MCVAVFLFRGVGVLRGVETFRLFRPRRSFACFAQDRDEEPVPVFGFSRVDIFRDIRDMDRLGVIFGFAEAAVEAPVVKAFGEVPSFFATDILPDFVFCRLKQTVRMFAFDMHGKGSFHGWRR